MSRPKFEVADIFRRHGEAYRKANAGHLDRCQLRVMAAIEACRTAALGGHVHRCRKCGLTEIAYCSCRDRHCPKCQGAATREWLAARQADLLDTEYFHVVFTLPQQIAALAYQNKGVVYGTLFEATVQTLKTIARDPKHLGARSASSRYCILGVRRLRTIPTYTVSFQAVVFRPTESAGFPAGPDTSCRNAFSHATSERYS